MFISHRIEIGMMGNVYSIHRCAAHAYLYFIYSNKTYIFILFIIKMV